MPPMNSNNPKITPKKAGKPKSDIIAIGSLKPPKTFEHHVL